MCDIDNHGSGAASGGRTYYGSSNSGSSGSADTRKCHHCKQPGHLKRYCPSLNQKKDNKPKKKERKPCAVKKFWCAFHKGDSSRRCYSDSCQDLAQLDPNQRVKLLKENGDCQHCVGDHNTKPVIVRERTGCVEVVRMIVDVRRVTLCMSCFVLTRRCLQVFG